jgi:hypothetical protein
MSGFSCKVDENCALLIMQQVVVESSWNVMAHGDAWEEKWRGNKRMEWVTSKCHMTEEHRLEWAVQTLQADVHASPASSQINWPPRRFKWTHPFCWKTKSGFCACAITFQMQSNSLPTFRDNLSVPSSRVKNPLDPSRILDLWRWDQYIVPKRR